LSDSDFTTKTCSICATEFPADREHFYACKTGKYGLSGWCKECFKEHERARRAEHPEVVIASSRAYHLAHLEECRDRGRDYYVRHREQRIAAMRVYRAEHLEERRAWDRAYSAEHLDEAVIHSRNRRARKKGNGGTHTSEDVRAQYERQKGKCFYCGERVGDKYHVDHVMPLILEGSNGKENIVIACQKCNCSKGGKHPMDFCGRLL